MFFINKVSLDNFFGIVLSQGSKKLEYLDIKNNLNGESNISKTTKIFIYDRKEDRNSDFDRLKGNKKLF